MDLWEKIPALVRGLVSVLTCLRNQPSPQQEQTVSRSSVGIQAGGNVSNVSIDARGSENDAR